MSLPPLKAVDLEKLSCAQLDLLRMFRRFDGESLTLQLCQRIAHNLHFALDVPPNSVYQTLVQYEGTELTGEWPALLAQQLVARQEELVEGLLQLYTRPVRDEWVALEITEVRESLWRDEHPGIEMGFLCLTGHPAGHRIRKNFPERWSDWLAYQLGFSRRVQYDYDISKFVGLRLYGFLKANLEDSSALDFEDWRVPAKVLQQNKLVIYKRMRFDVEPHLQTDKYSCPFDYEHYCSECQRGFWECPASPDRNRSINERVRPHVDAE